jgi:hypothetical protein
MLESLKGYRTVAFNVVSGLVIAAMYASGHADTAAQTAAQATSALNDLLAAGAGLIVVGNVALRALTSTPIFTAPKGN